MKKPHGLYLVAAMPPPLFFSSYTSWTGAKRTKSEHCIVCILQEKIITVAYHYEKPHEILKTRTIIMDSSLEILHFYSS